MGTFSRFRQSRHGNVRSASKSFQETGLSFGLVGCFAMAILLAGVALSFILLPLRVRAGGLGSSAIPPNGPGLDIPDPDDFGFNPWDIPNPPLDPWTTNAFGDPELPGPFTGPPLLPEVVPAITSATGFIPVVFRQVDCSLTREVFDGTFTLTTAANFPHYETFLQEAGNLTTPYGTWPNGCAQQTLGIASQQLEAVQPPNNGMLTLAAVNLGVTFPGSDGQNVVVGTITTGTSQPMALATYPVVSSSYITSTLAVADLNGDGINDIVVVSVLNAATGSAGEVSILLGKSGGTFQAAKTIPINVQATNVTVDDMNADGKPDLVVTGVSSPGVAVLLGNGDGTFGAEIDGPSDAEGLAAVTADFNHDGKRDVALSSGEILLGNGDGTLHLLSGTLSTVVPNGGDPAPGRGIVASDFNGDGVIDLAVTNRLTSTVDTYLGNGDGTFRYKSSYATLYGARSIAASDMNGDGIVDLFVGTASGGIFMSDVGTIGLYEPAVGNGDGTFTSGGDAYMTNSNAMLFGTVFDVADFNGDGKPDMVSVDVDPTNTTPILRVRKGTGKGQFADFASTVINSPGLLTGQSTPVALVAADFNGDSTQDALFAVANRGAGTSTISFAQGNGDGTFEPQVDYPVPAGAIYSLVSTDINGDGKPDIVMLANPSTSGTTTQTVITAMLNNGNGTFKAAQLLDMQANLVGLAVGDLNGDGKPDLIVSTGNQFTNSPGNLLIYLGNGDGTFQKPTSLTAGTYPGALAIGDYNNDGHPDLEVYTVDSSGNPLIALLLGNGNGTFQAASTFQLPETGVTGLEVAEIKGGARPVVLMTSCCGLAHQIFATGPGDGTITTSGIFTTGVSSQHLKLADVNGDGIPDILFTSGSELQYAVVVNLSAVVSIVNTATTLTATPVSAPIGSNVSLNAAVTPGSGSVMPAGTVTFLDGTNQLGTGMLNASGVATFSTDSLAVGTHSITAAYGGNANFAASTSAAATVTITATSPASFSVSGSPVTVPAGATTGNTSAISVTPVSGFTGNVALTAVISNSPAGAQNMPTLSFGSTTPVSVTSASAASATLTIMTTAPSNSSQLHKRSARQNRLLGGVSVMACMLSFGWPWRRNFWRGRLGVLVCLAILSMGVFGCGGGKSSGGGGGASMPGTTPGTYTVTLTGSSGTLTANGTITLTVQ